MEKTRIQMYEENAYKHAYKCEKKTMHTNVWQKQAYKHAYKFMKKTCIQTRIKMYEKKQAYQCMKKNRHTNVWKKHAYQCMKKTRIQMCEKNTRVEMFLGRSHDCWHCIGSLSSWGRRKKRMKTLGMRKAFWKFGQIFICIHTNVWQNPAYKHAYKCMTKTCIQTRIQINEKNA